MVLCDPEYIEQGNRLAGVTRGRHWRQLFLRDGTAGVGVVSGRCAGWVEVFVEERGTGGSGEVRVLVNRAFLRRVTTPALSILKFYFCLCAICKSLLISSISGHLFVLPPQGPNGTTSAQPRWRRGTSIRFSIAGKSICCLVGRRSILYPTSWWQYPLLPRAFLRHTPFKSQPRSSLCSPRNANGYTGRWFTEPFACSNQQNLTPGGIQPKILRRRKAICGLTLTLLR